MSLHASSDSDNRDPGLAGGGDAARTVPAVLDAGTRSSVKVLVAGDDAGVRSLCDETLRSLGYAVTVSGRAEEAADLLRRRRFDVAVVDGDLNRGESPALMHSLAAVASETFVAVITGAVPVQSVLDAPPFARAFLAKPFTARHLELVVERLAHGVLAARRVRSLRHDMAGGGPGEAISVIGQSAALRQAVELARRVAPTEAPVFITGESGSGKEQIAQFIHLHSRRAARPMLALNCAALPEALLESEMFGHRRGAFTGAVGERPGLLEAAHRSSLFLDELTEMPVTLQAKLLRVIQDGHVRRVGSNSTDAVVDVRFIAATNRPPQEAITEGRLRRDLFYRLRVIPIHIPPLRERTEDIPALASYFLEDFWSRHRLGEIPMPVLGADAIADLQARPWPGNVRELQNTIEYAVVLLDPGQVITPDDLPAFGEGGERGVGIGRAAAGEDFAGESYHEARERVLAEFERGYLTWLVDRATGNISRAARMAGVDRTTLYRLMDKYGFQRGASVNER